jgi:hypothetical protein
VAPDQIYLACKDNLKDYYVGTMKQLVDEGLTHFAPLSPSSVEQLPRLKHLLGEGTTLTDLRVDPLIET